MSEQLALGDLLQELDPSKTDATVLQFCLEAEQQSHAGNHWQAIRLAQAAASAAVSLGQPLTIGAAFLYLAVVRHKSGEPVEHEAARQDCATAITWLKRDPHQRAIAEIIQSQLLVDDRPSSLALESLQRAEDLLVDLAQRSRHGNQLIQERKYWNLHRSVSKSARLQRQHVRVKEPPVTSDDCSTPQYRVYLESHVPVPIVWPTDGLMGLGLVTLPGTVAPDYIDLSSLSIDGQRYYVESMSRAYGGEPFRLYPRQPYVILELVTNKVSEPPCYVLVRRHDRPDQEHQYLIIVDPAHEVAWVDAAESTAPHTFVHIVGAGREWHIRDGSVADRAEETGLWVYGIVEAIMAVASTTPRPSR